LVLDNIPIIAWSADAQGVVTMLEGMGTRLLGLEPGQLVGQSIYDVYHDSPEVCGYIRRALSGETFVAILELNNVILEARYAPLRGEQGDVIGVVGVSTDVTQREQAERELRAKVEFIEKQKSAIRAMSLPIIQVWDDVLALPVIGVLDSGRAADLMETLLRAVVDTRARYVILDLTGVDTIDTATADHLIKLVHAVRLLGTRAVVTGIQPTIAHVLVSLGAELSHITTLRNLREAIRMCMREMEDDLAPRAQVARRS